MHCFSLSCTHIHTILDINYDTSLCRCSMWMYVFTLNFDHLIQPNINQTTFVISCQQSMERVQSNTWSHRFICQTWPWLCRGLDMCDHQWNRCISIYWWSHCWWKLQDEYRGFCGQIRPNASTFIGWHFIIQRDIDPQHKAKATKELSRVKRWSHSSVLSLTDLHSTSCRPHKIPHRAWEEGFLWLKAFSQSAKHFTQNIQYFAFLWLYVNLSPKHIYLCVDGF